MIQNLTKLYEGAPLSGANTGVIYLPILFDCNLQGIDILTDENVVGDCVFTVTKNGVLIAGSTLTVSTGTRIESSGVLDVDLVKGDEIALNMTSGSLNSPITLNLVVDDGEAGGVGPQGEQGPAGPQGPQGPQGATGAAGPAGAVGATGAAGAVGATGATGAAGTNGVGVPAGGTTEQILSKNSNADYDTHWVDKPAGGTGGSASAVEEKIVFLGRVGCTQSNNSSLVGGNSTLGVWGGNGAYSEQTAHSGDVKVQAKIGVLNQGQMFGISNAFDAMTDSGFANIDFAMFIFSDNKATVMENGVAQSLISSPTVTTDDVLSISLEGGQVVYRVNATIIRTNAAPTINYPLKADVALTGNGATLKEPKITYVK